MYKFFSMIGIICLIILLFTGCLKRKDNLINQDEQLASLSTTVVTSITQTSATTGGNVTAQGSSSVTSKGVCWSTSSDPTTNDIYTEESSGTGSFTSYLTGLNPNTLYYVRAYATNSQGTAYGNQVSFTSIGYTGGTVPTVTTNAASNITLNSASAGGNVNSQGSATVTAKGVCWSTSQNPTTYSSHTTNGTGTGSFSSSLTGLSSNTIYYIRAYATNSVGTAYGNQLNFTTTGTSGGQPCPGTPTVTYSGKTYNTVQIGSQCWLKENLNLGSRINSTTSPSNNGVIEKYCYDDNESNCSVYGGLYDWYEMMQWNTTEGGRGICPTGWHVPTNDEFSSLVSYLGGTSVAGGKMKETGTNHWLSPNNGATNSSGFTALPGGQCRWYNQSFYGLETVSYFWSSTPYNYTAYWYWCTDYGLTSATKWGGDDMGHSVRCLKD